MKNLTLVMTKGLPASGKSTWAKKMVEDNPGKWKRINKDDLRAMFDNGKHSKGNENFILTARNDLIQAALLSGYNVIVDDTNFHPKHEKALRELVATGNDLCGDKIKIDFRIQDFTFVPLQMCIERDRERTVGHVGENVIRNMHREFLYKEPPEVSYDPLLEDAVLCDLDGTLAKIGDRNRYDASTCDVDDSVNMHVVLSVKALHAQKSNVHIIFVSGRQEKDRLPTQRFISNKAFFKNYQLLMRATGDQRHDEIVKQEIYDNSIRGKYNVIAVFDDRPKVVRMWKALGLPVFNCGDSVEF